MNNYDHGLLGAASVSKAMHYASPIVGSLLSAPSMLTGAIASPLGFLAGVAGSYIGSEAGGVTGKWIDPNDLYDGLNIGKAVGGLLGGMTYGAFGSMISAPKSTYTPSQARYLSLNRSRFAKEALFKNFLGELDPAARNAVKDLYNRRLRYLISSGLNTENYENYGALGTDIRDWPRDIIEARKNGNYPLTYAERKQWVNDFKKLTLEGVRKVSEENLNNPNLKSNWHNKLILGNPELAVKFGTRRAINTFGLGDVYPSEADYSAFAKGGNAYFPFRSHKNTLFTHIGMSNPGERTQTGAHEFEHLIQNMYPYEKQLTVYDPSRNLGTYNMYTNEKLPKSLIKAMDDVLVSNERIGEWEGSLAEIDSELKGWRALYNYPKYSEMTPSLKLHIIDLANNRFGICSDYSTTTAQFYKLLAKLPLDDYISSTLDDLKFHKLFTELENAGYKQGGKLAPNIKRNNYK